MMHRNTLVLSGYACLIGLSLVACRTGETKSGGAKGPGVGVVVAEDERDCGSKKPPTGGTGTCPNTTPTTTATATASASPTPMPGKPGSTYTPISSNSGGNQVNQSNGGKGNGTFGALTVTGKRLDCSVNGLEIQVQNSAGTWVAVNAPKRGEIVTIDSVCPMAGAANLVVRMRYGANVFPTDQSGCFMGKSVDSKTVVAGFKRSCPGGDGMQLNEAIFSMSCDGSNSLSIDKLPLSTSLDLTNWAGKDGC